ncbi:odorant receptor 46a isoform X3 [Solenopsis invicta]|uniref:odorant receptor 46a isoform X3 n=1 Tax=Solenopsis invicta TaxID=13686 RepID=UPI00193DB9FE|nr:odorant receptor 46a isoform X3 [Solenopsis invicta]
MQILALNFLFYTIGGVWRPIKWSSKCSICSYSVLNFFSLYLLTFFVLTQLIDTIFIVDNIDDFTTNLSLLLSAIAVYCKAVTATARRSEFISLIKMLQEKPCKACNEEEINIQMKYDRLIRSYTMSYSILASFSLTGITIGEVLIALQVAMALSTFVNVATETVILGFCLQICAQFDILICRLRKVIESDEKQENELNSATNKTSRLSENIHYHLYIIRFAKMVNKVFSQIVFIQFFVSILVLCTSVYYLSSHKTVTDFIKLGIYTSCMFVQIFMYCWAGNEIILKSIGLSEAVYKMEWILLTISERKDLLMIMMRSTKPIKFTSSFLVTLSLESYATVSTKMNVIFEVLFNMAYNYIIFFIF